MYNLQHNLRRQLLREASAGDAAFDTSGILELARRMTLFFMGDDGQCGAVTFPVSGNEPTELQPLLAACTPAKFGLRRRTRHDPAVRSALQLPAAQLALDLASHAELLSPALLEELRRLMMPAAAAVRAEPYALNVYGPGGFFKAHVDTLRSAGMFGSLVVCLPTDFSGGQLIVRSPNLASSVTHDWGAAGLGGGGDDEEGPAARLAWAAFYSDCEHEILPVTTGQRVTLTFNLIQVAAASPTHEPAPAASSAAESAFGLQLSSALRDATWCPEGARLGFVLEHHYAVSAASKRLPTAITPGSLKGSDYQLWLAADALQLQTRLVPVLQLTECGWDDETGEEREKEPAELLALGKFKAEAEAPQGSSSGDEEGMREGMSVDESIVWFAGEEPESDFVARLFGARVDPSIAWIKLPGKQHMRYRAKAYAYANDVEDNYWYAAGALIVVVPAAGAPERAQLAA